MTDQLTDPAETTEAPVTEAAANADPGDPTLAEVVTANANAARVLEGFGLDYCCGGKRPLSEAATAAGVDPAEVRAAIAAAEPAATPEWAGLGPAALVDHLEATHHAYLHAELPRLAALAAKVHEVHGARHPELAEVHRTFDALRLDLEPHLMKEEAVLFPMVRELAAASEAPAFHCGSLQNPIRVMEHDHDRAGELLEDLRRLTDGYTPPADGCASYQALYAGLAHLEADTHLHVHKENNVLFPAVVALEAEVAAR
jgi:regulator of cell morphogenesis and NO signaling